MTGRVVECPRCVTRYRLPDALLGPAGARVRCPRCGETFAVAPLADPGPLGAPAADAVKVATPPETLPAVTARPPIEVAYALLDGLLAHSGADLRAAQERGELFAEWGPALLALFEEYRREVGARADAAPFRHALRERLGVDLPESARD